MSEILDDEGLRYYANKICNADNRKVGTQSLSTALNEIDIAIDGFKNAFEQEYGTPIDMNITNNQSVFVVGTGNGINKKDDVENSFTDLKINGNTLVNLMPTITGKSFRFHANSDWTTSAYRTTTQCLKPNTVYTIIVDIYANNLSSTNNFYVNIEYDNLMAFTEQWKVNGIGRYVKAFTTKSALTKNMIVPRTQIEKAEEGKYVDYSIILLKGDWTNKTVPEYFEGIKSVGEKDNKQYIIDILSQGKNLIDFSMKNIENFSGSSFDFTQASNNAIRVRSHYFQAYGFKQGFYVKKGEQYTITVTGMKEGSGYYSAMYLGDTALRYGNNNTYILIPASTGSNIIETINSFSTKSVTMTALKDGYISRWIIHSYDQSNYYQIKSIQIEKGNTATTFESYKYDKKEIILNEPLRGLPNGVKDTINKINGSWKLVRRCGEIILDESQDWYGSARVNGLSWAMQLKNKVACKSIGCCDTLPIRDMYYSSNKNIACLYPDNITITLPDSDTALNASSSESAINNGIKQWLKYNPTKVIYELVVPIIEDIDPITVQCWKNGTIAIDEILPVETTHTVALNKSAQIQKNIEELTMLKNRVETLEEQYNRTALNQAYEVELLKLDMKLDDII